MVDSQSNTGRPEQVLSVVASRIMWARYGRRWSWLVVAFSVVAGTTVLFVRLSGLVPYSVDSLLTRLGSGLGLETTGMADWTGLGLLAGVLVAGVVVASAMIAGIWRDRPTVAEAARAVDSHQGTKDLFLTLTMLDESAGDYQPLVSRDATAAAARVQPARVVPFAMSHGSVRPAIALALVAALALAVPQLDPFGEVAQAEEIKQKRKQLEQEAARTKARRQQLATDESDNSPQVKQAIEDLKAALKAMKKAEGEANRNKIAQLRKQLSDLHKMVDAHKLKKTLNRTDGGQKFGKLDAPKTEKWAKELKEGSTDSLKKELQQMKKDFEEVAKLAGDQSPEAQKKKDELAQNLQKKLRDIQSFANQKLDSKHPLAAALKRARQQMKAMQTGDKELAESAQKHLRETMELAKQELQELAQTARDLEELEKALETARMAQKANEKGEADGERLENAESLDDYREFYQQLMEELGEQLADGDGTGNRGFGKGGEVPEDDSVDTGFKTEVSKSALTAGKVLLSMKTKGQSDTGDAKQVYRDSVKAVKQGVSEAIDKEEIPKGYIDGIKKYFQSLDDKVPNRQPAGSAAPAASDAPKK